MNPGPLKRPTRALERLIAHTVRSRRILEEISAHLDDCAEALLQRGLSPSEAHAEAERRFGDPELLAIQIQEMIIMEDDAFRRRMALLAVTPSVAIACLFAATMIVMSVLFHPQPAYLAVVALGAVVVLGASGLCARQVFSSRTRRDQRASDLRLASIAAGIVGLVVGVGTAIQTAATGDGDGYAVIGAIGIVAAAIASFLLAEYDRLDSRRVGRTGSNAPSG